MDVGMGGERRVERVEFRDGEEVRLTGGMG